MRLLDAFRLLPTSFKPKETAMTNVMVPHSAAVHRAIEAIEKSRALISAQNSEIDGLKATVSDLESQVTALTAALNGVVPVDVGGSSGGITG